MRFLTSLVFVLACAVSVAQGLRLGRVAAVEGQVSYRREGDGWVPIKVDDVARLELRSGDRVRVKTGFLKLQRLGEVAKTFKTGSNVTLNLEDFLTESERRNRERLERWGVGGKPKGQGDLVWPVEIEAASLERFEVVLANAETCCIQVEVYDVAGKIFSGHVHMNELCGYSSPALRDKLKRAREAGQTHFTVLLPSGGDPIRFAALSSEEDQAFDLMWRGANAEVDDFTRTSRLIEAALQARQWSLAARLSATDDAFATVRRKLEGYAAANQVRMALVRVHGGQN